MKKIGDGEVDLIYKSTLRLDEEEVFWRRVGERIHWFDPSGDAPMKVMNLE